MKIKLMRILKTQIFILLFIGCNGEDPETQVNESEPHLDVAGGGHSLDYNFYHFTPKLLSSEMTEDVILEIRHESFHPLIILLPLNLY